ncbi:hypothetical protein PIB30_075332 [Stylosanthes scabra]|uniref:Uncharacterized protein n=1 Tax=Stylosanthes scabra TaxID=79078 RepID=A0ABU6RR49_9FABA|nr:hypothetical protein [Stylosanthes scabra]
MGFGALSHLPNKNLNQQLLKQIYDRYDIHDNTIYSDAESVKLTTKKIGHALGLCFNGVGYLAPGRGLADELILGFDEGRGVSMLGVGTGRLGVDELLCLLS